MRYKKWTASQNSFASDHFHYGLIYKHALQARSSWHLWDICSLLKYLLTNALLSLKDMKFTISQFLHLSKNIKWKHGRHISTRPLREWCKGSADWLFLWETDLVKMTDIVKLRRPRRKANVTSGLKTQRDFWTGPSNLYWPAARVLSISFCLVFDISLKKSSLTSSPTFS